MRTLSILGVLVAMSAPAVAETATPGPTVPTPSGAASTYVGVGVTLTNGLDGSSELGGALSIAPIPNLEVEVGAIRHDVEGHEDLDFHTVWLATAAVRAKAPLRRGALFAGIGVITGEHSRSEGCSSSGFIDFCGEENGTHVYRHWDRVVWITPELGGELALGPIAMRMSVAPVIDVSQDADFERGCLECSDSKPEVVINIGIHGHIPVF